MKVLLIEDDVRVRETLEIILCRHDHDVRVALDGQQGLALFAAWKPDVVVTDIIMPEVEGIETIMTIRRQAPDAAIVAMSGGTRLAATDYLEIAKELGADVTLRKPIRSEELLAAIDAACESHSRHA
jgi:DNA-binding response OmpR family regulator